MSCQERLPAFCAERQEPRHRAPSAEVSTLASGDHRIAKDDIVHGVVEWCEDRAVAMANAVKSGILGTDQASGAGSGS